MSFNQQSIKRVKRAMKTKIQVTAATDTNAATYAVLSQGAALAATMTPVDTSNLINSQHISPIVDGKGTVAYTADYASAVHAAPGTLKGQPRENGRGNYWEPSGEPQFLEKAFEELKPSIPAIIKRAAKK